MRGSNPCAGFLAGHRDPRHPHPTPVRKAYGSAYLVALPPPTGNRGPPLESTGHAGVAYYRQMGIPPKGGGDGGIWARGRRCFQGLPVPLPSGRAGGMVLRFRAPASVCVEGRVGGSISVYARRHRSPGLAGCWSAISPIHATSSLSSVQVSSNAAPAILEEPPAAHESYRREVESHCLGSRHPRPRRGWCRDRRACSSSGQVALHL